MRLTTSSYFKKQAEIKKVEEEINDLKLKATDYESLKVNKKYKRFRKDLELYKEQLKIIEERIGKEKIGQEIIDRMIDKNPWMKQASKKLFGRRK